MHPERDVSQVLDERRKPHGLGDAIGHLPEVRAANERLERGGIDGKLVMVA